MIYSPFWGSRYSTVVFKYLSQAIKTMSLLFRERPGVVFVMTPPVAACFPVWLYSRLTGSAFIIDAHSGAFLDPRWQSIIFLHRFFSRRARATILTNQYLQAIVESWGAAGTIVSDVPIEFVGPKPKALAGRCNMVFVSSFTSDEPLSIFLQAAAHLSDIQFYVTGDFQAASREILELKPANVEFTGFLPKSEYAGLLMASDAVICLTTLNHTMQRGAYEAVYLGKPVITSNTELLRQAFYKGAVHVEPTVTDILRGILKMKQNLRQYISEVGQLRDEKLERWKKTEMTLREFAGGSARSAASNI
jgi:glycosyltransferase involved in cell wall biosynthesis